MPNIHLTSSDMNMMAELLDEVAREDFRQFNESSTVLARLLVRSFEGGISDRPGLRDVMKGHLRLHRRHDAAIDRWESEGGATPIALGLKFPEIGMKSSPELIR